MNHSYSAPTRDTGRITKVFVNSIIGFLMKLNKSHDYVQINNKIIEKSNNQIIGQNVSGLILCKLAQCVSILAVSVSVLTLVAISWDRSWFFVDRVMIFSWDRSWFFPGTGHNFFPGTGHDFSWGRSSFFIHTYILNYRYNAIMSPLKPRLSKMKTSLIAVLTWCLGR